MFSQFQHPVGSRNRTKILNALMELGNSYPFEIKNYLDNQADRLIENRYNILSESQKKVLIKKATISERSIFTWLRKLVKQGLVIHEDNKYRLSNQFYSDTEFTAGLFGLNILSNILARPIDPNSDESIAQTVNCFGVFIIYILSYCLQPIQETNYTTDKKQLEDMRIMWVNNAISPEHMLTILREQLGLLKISSTTKAKAGSKKIKFQELAKEKYQKLIHHLEVKYPEIFSKINEGIENTYSMIKSKSGITNE
jgi:hypothetical protein